MNAIETLAATIRCRRSDTSARSYTRTLLDGGVAKCSKKLGEEATETIIAAMGESDEALIAEAADLIFHLLVLLEARDVSLGDVCAELDRRAGTSGLDEKASRRIEGKDSDV